MADVDLEKDGVRTGTDSRSRKGPREVVGSLKESVIDGGDAIGAVEEPESIALHIGSGPRLIRVLQLSWFMPSMDLSARIAEEAASLPPDQQSTVLDFVLFVKERSKANSSRPDDAAWERIIADPRPRPRLEAFLRDSLGEGEEPLDLNRL